MKELIITTVATIGLLMVASFANADSSRLELYYNDCITKKIVHLRGVHLLKTTQALAWFVS